MTTIKLECIENPGGSCESTTVRDCEASDKIPFGICVHEVEQCSAVYHTPSGHWVYKGGSIDCEVFLQSLESHTEQTSLSWELRKDRTLNSKQVMAFCYARSAANLF